VDVDPRVVSTMSGPWPTPVREIIPSVAGYWRFLALMWRAGTTCEVVIARGTSGFHEGYAEVVAAILLKLRRRKRPVIFMTDAGWNFVSERLNRRLPAPLRPLLPAVGRAAIRLADGPHVVYGVLSTAEQRAFPGLWGVDPERVLFTPFFATIPPELVSESTPGDYVLAGGNTNRDYELLVEAVRGLDVPVVIAANWTPARPLPDNVTVTYTTAEEYDRLQAGARAVVVPLKDMPRSSGQQTYLNGMLLGKPTIVTDAAGVRDHVRHGETALVVEPSAPALRAALEWVLDPAHESEVRALTQRAQAAVQAGYLRPHYFACLYRTALEQAAARSGG
jgi:hypothetical protein